MWHRSRIYLIQALVTTHYLPFTRCVLKQGETRQGDERERGALNRASLPRLSTSEAHDPIRVLLLDALLGRGIARISEHCFSFRLYRNFLCSSPREETGLDDIPHMKTDEKGSATRLNWWIWVNFLSLACATSSRALIWIHVSRIPTYLPSFATLRVFAYISCRSVIDCFWKKMNHSRVKMSYLDVSVFMIPLEKGSNVVENHWWNKFYSICEAILLLTRSVIDFTRLSEVNLIPTACLQYSEKFAYTSY